MANPVVQSGTPGAVGLTVEGTFKTAPITNVGGNLNAIGIANTNPERFFIVDPGGGMGCEPQIEVPRGEIDGQRAPKRSVYHAHGPDGTYPGEFTFRSDAENLYYPLLAALGRDVQTQLTASAASTPYKHAMYPGRLYRPSFTVEEVLGDGTYGRVTSGCICPSLELDFNDDVTARMRLVGYGQSPNHFLGVDYDFGSVAGIIPASMGGDLIKTWKTTASPTFIDIPRGSPGIGQGNGPFVFEGMGFGGEAGFSSHFILVDGSPFTNDPYFIRGMTLAFTNAIQSFMTGGSGFEANATCLNETMCEGKLPVLFVDNQLVLAGRRHSKVSMNFKVTGMAIGATNQYYSIEVHIPQMSFVSTPPGNTNTALMNNSAFTCIYDDSAGYDIKVTLTNTTSNTLLAGKYASVSSPGGLGGYVIT